MPPRLENFEADDNLIAARFDGCFGHRLPQNLTSLNFASNRLFGPIGEATAGAVCLRFINLSNNKLTGVSRMEILKYPVARSCSHLVVSVS